VILLTIGNGLYIHLNTKSSIAEIVSFETVAGIGAGLLFEPPLIALQALVSQEDTATATATLGFIRSIAASFSVVIGGVVFQNGMQSRAQSLRAAGLSADVTEKLSGGDAAANVFLIKTVSDLHQKLVIKEAFAWSMRNMWILYTCVSACGIVAGAFIAKRALSKDHVETKTGIPEQKNNPLAADQNIGL